MPHGNPGYVEKPVQQHKEEQKVGCQFVKGECRGDRKLEERRERTVSRDWEEHHAHSYIANVTSKGNGRKPMIAREDAILTSSGSKVAIESGPPNAHDCSI